MKKILTVLTILIFVLSSLSYAKVYVCLSKTTGEPQGMVDIRLEVLNEWAENYIMIEADESYRGKKGYEIKMDNGKLRLATEQEITDYKQEQEQEQQQAVLTKEKEKFLDWLKDEDIKTEIKTIKEAEPVMMGSLTPKQKVIQKAKRGFKKWLDN